MELSTMPGWAGSSWYFSLRYMDPKNDGWIHCAKDLSDYWGQVDLYIGGSEHATEVTYCILDFGICSWKTEVTTNQDEQLSRVLINQRNDLGIAHVYCWILSEETK